MSSIDTFRPDCTLPNVTVHWLLPPDIRSSYNILWTSLATLLACVFTALQLDSPKPPERDVTDDSRGRFAKGLKGIKNFFVETPLKWAWFLFLMPEAIVMKMYLDRYHADEQLVLLRDGMEKMDTHNDTNGWMNRVEIIHMLFADMGGFVIEYCRCPRCAQKISQDGRTIVSNSRASATLGQRLDEESPQWHDQTETGNIACSGKISDRSTVHIDATRLREVMLKPYVLEYMPTKDEIKDRSKRDTFGTTMKLFQVTYFSATMLLRSFHQLPVSQLEWVVAGYVLLFALTYLFGWSKPKSVSTTITIARFTDGYHVIPAGLLSLAVRSEPIPSFWPNVFQWVGANLKTDVYSKMYDHRLETPYSNRLKTIFGGFSSVLGVAHLLSWNARFPTTTDRILWRVAAVISTAILPVHLTLTSFWTGLRSKRVYADDDLTLRCLFYFSASVYALARLVLFVEMFRCLLSLPIKAFVTTEFVEFPHIS